MKSNATDSRIPSGKSVKSIYLGAVEIEDERLRVEYLDEACQGDDTKRRLIENVLAAANSGQDNLLIRALSELNVEPEAEDGHTSPAVERPGTRIGPYILREQIGEGGMGVVYVAEQDKPVARKVALKIIKPGMDSKDVIARFEAEQQALALMDHPHIAKVHDAGTTESGRPYFVMELVRGVPITEFCDDQALSTRRRLRLFVDVCRAVQHAHQKGIIHRDIKPANVMVTTRDDRAIPKMIDFGIAKALGRKLTEKTIYTAFGQMVGTPLYMSPEQTQMNELDVDTRSDVYSLGVLLYELLTGMTPVDKQTIEKAGFDEVRRIIREDEPPRPSERISTLGAELLSTVSDKRKIDARRFSHSLRGELDWIVMKALEKDRGRRYESASALAADLERYLDDEPVEACPPSVGYRLGKYVRRNKLRFAMATVLAVAVLVAVGSIASSVGWMSRDRVRQARVAGQIELILDDVDRLIEQQKWPEAVAAANRAETALASGEADEETQQRVQEVLADLKMVQRLEEIRLLRSAYKMMLSGFDDEGTNQAYAAAFREHGIDVSKLSNAEAGKKCRSHSRVAVPLVTALDHWAEIRRRIDGSDRARWQRLVAIAKLVDSDPLRNRLRELCVEATTDEIKLELTELARADRLGEQPAATSVFLALTLDRAKLYEEAESVLRQAQQTYPADFWVNYRLAQTIAKQNPGDVEAIRFYSVALGLRPDNGAILTNLGIVFANQGNQDEAIACFRKVIEIDPKLSTSHYNLGIAFWEQGKLDEAIAWYRGAIEINPKSGQAYNNLGGVFWKQGKLGQATACWRKLLELSPKHAYAHNNLGVVLTDQGKLDEAITYCRKALELDPECGFAHSNLLEAFGIQGKLDEAITYYCKAIDLDPESETAHKRLGDVLREQGKLDLALASYNTALELKPDYDTAYYNRVKVYCDQKQYDLALADYRKRLEADPDSHKYRYAVALLRLNCPDPRFRDTAEALRLATEAVKLRPEFDGACFVLGQAHYRSGDYRAAIQALEKSLELDYDRKAQSWFVLAMAHWKLGDQEQARQVYQQAAQWMSENQPPGATFPQSQFRAEAETLLGIEERSTPEEKEEPHAKAQ